MKLTIHTAVIIHREGATQYVSASHDDLIYQIGAYCREHWPSVSGDPPPADVRDLIDGFFHENPKDSVETLEDDIDLPEPYASAAMLFAALRAVADTPKLGEPGAGDLPSGHDPVPDMGQGATARLHELIDMARAVIAGASVPSIRRFTVFCQEAGGAGTVHIASHEAADLGSAITAGKQQCIDDWSSGFREGDSPWNMQTVHCLGVAAGDVEILHWEDQAP